MESRECSGFSGGVVCSGDKVRLPLASVCSDKVRLPLVSLSTLTTVTLKPLSEYTPTSSTAATQCSAPVKSAALPASPSKEQQHARSLKSWITLHPCGRQKNLHHQQLKPKPQQQTTLQLCANNCVQCSLMTAATASAPQLEQNDSETPASSATTADSTQHSGVVVQQLPLKSQRARWTGLARSNTVGTLPPTAGMKSLTLERTKDIHLSQQSVSMCSTPSEATRSTSAIVRSRPRVPTDLRSARRHSEEHESVDDIAGALNSLWSTDWRKYSRKGPSSVSGGSTSTTLSPECHTPKSDISTPTVGRAPSFRTVRSRLENITKDEDSSESSVNQQVLSSNVESYSSVDGLNPAETTEEDNEVGETAEAPFVGQLGKFGFSLRLSDDDQEESNDDNFSSQLANNNLFSPNCDQQVTSDTEVFSSLSSEKLENDIPNMQSKTHPDLNESSSDSVFVDSSFNCEEPNYVALSHISQPLCSDDTESSDTLLYSESNQYASEQCLNSEHRSSPDSNKGLDGSNGDLVSKSVATLRALSSFESVKDSDEDMSLHVTEDDDTNSPKLQKNILPQVHSGIPSAVYKHVSKNEEVNQETEEDEGVVDVDPIALNRELYKTLTERVKELPGGHSKSGQGHNISTATSDNKEVLRHLSGRFLTHPPLKEKLSNEGGTRDSNGFGSIIDGRNLDNDGKSRISLTSSFDSHLCPSEGTIPSSVHEGTDDMMSDYHTDKAEDKSSKQVKQKSHGDPSGGNKIVDIPSVIMSHNPKSQPVSLSPEKRLLPKTNLVGYSEGSLSPLTDGKVRARSRSPRPDMKLLHNDDSSSAEEGQISIPVKRPSKKRQRGNSSDQWEPKERIAEKIPKTFASTLSASIASNIKLNKSKTVKITALPASLPATPLTSPENTLPRRAKGSPLTPDAGGRKAQPLLRSHSSASVLDTRKARMKLGEGFRSATCSAADLFNARNNREKPPGTGTFSPSLEPICSSSLSLFDGPDEGKKKRDLIVQEFYSTEKQYVEALQVLVERYVIPIKTQRLLDRTVVDEIFYKINEIYMHHATFLAFLDRALAQWDSEATIGDVIYKTFSKQSVVESYVLFIQNFPRAEKALDDISSKSAFQKFVEQVERESRLKLPLKAQIVKPAQRIPRYELLIKRLQEHTPSEHPDSGFLKQAEDAMHQVALRINSVKHSKSEEALQLTLKKLELLLITDLVASDRQYIRYDMVQVLNRKDQCCIWLFSDLIVISTVKRKSGPVNRKSSLLLQSPSGNDFIENTKQRLWLKLSLEDVEIVKGDQTSPVRKSTEDKAQLEEDYRLLSEISEMSHKLQHSHDNLDQVVHDLIAQINKQLSEYQLKCPPPEATKIDLAATISNGMVLNITVVFPSPEKKTSWMSLVNETKRKLSKVGNTKPPEFLQALQITKTRAGMQFSCASPIEGLNGRGFCDVWVCNSDGYVGHMCLLTLQPEPIVTLNTPVPGCNSRILCICAVPAVQDRASRPGSIRRRAGVVTQPPTTTLKLRPDNTDFSEDGYVSDASTSDSDTTDVEMTDDSIQLSSSVKRTDSDRSEQTLSSRSDSPASVAAPSTGHSPKDSTVKDPHKSTMWLGTEDGFIHTFLAPENVRTSKNRVKLQQTAAVLCIVYSDNSVFVSLANGDLVVYRRDSEGQWETNEYDTVTLTSASAPVNKILPVAGKLWCAANNDIIVVNPSSLEPELTFTGNPDSRRGIHTMVCSGQGVWVAGNGSSKVLLFHATHFELLMEVSVTQAVTAKLQYSDDIIRQHKTACLRITSLLACKEVLWMGTSAGVILTIPMPKVTAMATRSSLTVPPVTGLCYGHTGHVRFLTCVEMPNVNSSSSTKQHHNLNPENSNRQKQTVKDPRRKSSINLLSYSCGFLVISGGDGFEDFSRNANGEEVTGKDDSTNHLLMWRA